MKILVINAGSSSIKLALYTWSDLNCIAKGLVDFGVGERSAEISLQYHDGVSKNRVPAASYREGLLSALQFLKNAGVIGSDTEIYAMAHRLIHGGETLREPVVINEEVKKIIRSFRPLAPLHIPAGLEAIEAAESLFPWAVQTGVFDTGFFADIPPAAYLYPVPYEWYEKWGIRRFGYHGTSHQYACERAAEMLGRDLSSLRLITCHLGQGSSASAIQGGKAVTNTMGFTPLEGFMMGTRSGTVDPGIITYVQKHYKLTVEEVEEILHKRSGLLGVSGVSGDYRQVYDAAKAGNSRAKLALEMYAYRVRAMLGALAVTMGGVDALVFTGGIGENARELRADICRGLECLRLHLDPERNAHASPDAEISAPTSPGKILVIHSREDYILARAAKRLVEKREKSEVASVKASEK
uniref:Acetate kinase n=1 Tax=uncultured Planctomycetota bacterium TaxID=120965 RepID=H5SDP5_9BACT|nr:acetate kinase [uncultured Planctomycetota bacterium]